MIPDQITLTRTIYRAMRTFAVEKPVHTIAVKFARSIGEEALKYPKFEEPLDRWPLRGMMIECTDAKIVTKELYGASQFPLAVKRSSELWPLRAMLIGYEQRWFMARTDHGYAITYGKMTSLYRLIFDNSWGSNYV